MKPRSNPDRGAVRNRRRLLSFTTDWIDGDFCLYVNRNPVTIVTGSRQRALPCVVCESPAGGQECYLLCVVAGILCPNDNAHLNGAGMFCHVTCLPGKDEAIVGAVVRALTSVSH